MKERDKAWRKWCDDNVGITRNEDLLYQCWVAAWEASQNDVSDALDMLIGSGKQIIGIGKTPRK